MTKHFENSDTSKLYDPIAWPDLPPDEAPPPMSAKQEWENLASWIAALRGVDTFSWWLQRDMPNKATNKASAAPVNGSVAADKSDTSETNTADEKSEKSDRIVAESQKSETQNDSQEDASTSQEDESNALLDKFVDEEENESTPRPALSLHFSMGGQALPWSQWCATLPQNMLEVVRERGWYGKEGEAAVTRLYAQALGEGTLKPERHAEEGVTRLSRHRVRGRLFEDDRDLSRRYWAHLFRTNKESSWPGLPWDDKARELHRALSLPYTTKAMNELRPKITHWLRHRGAWEHKAKQSLRWWAHTDKRWQKFLDKLHVSCRTVHEDRPLLARAMEAGWIDGVDQWLKESNASMDTIPMWDQIPNDWKQRWSTPVRGTLWHWYCAVAPTSAIEKWLERDPDILDVRDPDGSTALHWACAMGRGEVVDILARAGANLEVENDQGAIPAELWPEGYDAWFDCMERWRAEKVAPEDRRASEEALRISGKPKIRGI